MTFQDLQEKVSKEQQEASLTAKYEDDILTIKRCFDKLLEAQKERTDEYLRQLKEIQNA